MSPQSADEWQETVERFERGLGELSRHVEDADLHAPIRKKKPAEILQVTAAHNSYHLGQIVLLRQLIGAWPPAAGGFTW